MEITLKERLKLAAKCLLGRKIGPEVTSHEYKLLYEDKDKLQDLSILVTGGSGAIGSGIAYELAAMGAKVGIAGRSLEKINLTIEKVNHYSPAVANNMTPIVFNVNNDTEMEVGISEFVDKYGKIDVLINNAGGQPGRLGENFSLLCEKPIEQIDLILETNLRGTILCSRIASKYMISQKFGQIINMGSVIGLGGKGGYSDYAATKAGIIGFSKSLALELAAYGIRVNCISPGVVNQTPFDGGSPERFTPMNVVGRAGYTKEVADAVVYLITNHYVTGQNLIVDGGRFLGLFGDSK